MRNDRRIKRWHTAENRRFLCGKDLNDPVRGGPAIIDHRRRTNRQREGHGIAKAIGEKELRRRKNHVVRPDPQHLSAVGLCRRSHRRMHVMHPLRLPRRPRGVEPKRGLIIARRKSRQRRFTKRHEVGIRQRMARNVIANHDHMPEVRVFRQDRRNTVIKRAGHNQHRRPAVTQHRVINGRGQQRIQRHCNDSSLESPPKQHRKFDLIQNQHRHPLFASDIQRAQRRGDLT
mmetsp:Transcript_23786/g.42804  ORF Transcript_23786/g.42804 Transcript_23786/m.42804 type:complete len:231 (+) Transcript_23786:772-1464(+)